MVRKHERQMQQQREGQQPRAETSSDRVTGRRDRQRGREHDGRVDIATLVILGPGEYFGEMAIVSPAPRNATVVALEPVETLALHRDEFNELRRQHRWIESFLVEALAEELRRSSLRLLEALYVSVD